MRILIIDDEKNWCDTLEILINETYENSIVECLIESKKAKEIIESFKPDIILIDFDMPGMNGDEVLKQCYGLLEKYNIKVLLMSKFFLGSIMPNIRSHVCGFIDKCDMNSEIEHRINTVYYIKEIEEQVKKLREENERLKNK